MLYTWPPPPLYITLINHRSSRVSRSSYLVRPTLATTSSAGSDDGSIDEGAGDAEDIHE